MIRTSVGNAEIRAMERHWPERAAGPGAEPNGPVREKDLTSRRPMVERVGTSSAAGPVTAAPPNRAAPDEAPPAPPGREARRRGRFARVPRRRLFAILAVLLIGGGGIAGYRWWQDSLAYVSTDNAQIGGYLVQVGTLSAGRVTSVLYDIGDRVSIDDVVARGVVPTTLSQTGPGTPRQQYLGR